MKNVCLSSLLLLFSFSYIHAQSYFVGDITFNGKKAIFTIKAVGASITDKISGMDFYVRWPNDQGNTVTFDDLTTNQTDFPGIAFLQNNDEFTEPGYHVQHFYYTGMTSTTRTYTLGVTYEVFRVNLGGDIPTPMDLVADNGIFDPYLFNVSGFAGVDYSPYLVAPFPGAINSTGTFWYKRFLLIALPINLKSFSGKVVDCRASLDWTTTTETNSKYFAIQYSPDGNNFTTVATVPAAGTTYGDQSYSKTVELKASENYYRLEMVSTDDNTRYSKVVMLKSGACPFAGPASMKVFPNPVVDQTIELTVSNAKAGTVQVELMDVLGKPVQSFSQKLHIGENHLRLKLLFKAQGVYFLKVGDAKDTIGYQKIMIE